MLHLVSKSLLRLRRAWVGAALAASLSSAALPATASAQLTIDQLELHQQQPAVILQPVDSRIDQVGRLAIRTTRGRGKRTMRIFN